MDLSRIVVLHKNSTARLVIFNTINQSEGLQCAWAFGRSFYLHVLTVAAYCHARTMVLRHDCQHCGKKPFYAEA